MRRACLELLGDVGADERQAEDLVDGEPVARVLGQAAADDQLEVVVQVLPQRGKGLLDVLPQALHVARQEGHLAVAQLVKHHAEGPQIHRIVVLPK